MNFTIKQDVENAMDEEAIRLISVLAVEPEKTNDLAGTFHPNYLSTVASIRHRETPNSLVQPIIGTDGFEVARFFPDICRAPAYSL